MEEKIVWELIGQKTAVVRDFPTAGWGKLSLASRMLACAF